MRARCAMVCALMAAACEARDRPQPQGQGGGPSPSASVQPTMAAVQVGMTNKSETLASDQPIVELPIEKRLPAIVSLPVGATEKKPVLVAAHGRDDYPRPLCEMFRGIVNDRAFVVCPTGVPSTVLPGAFTYDSFNELAAEIEDALTALAVKYPSHVDDGPIIYAGFSLGSFQGVRVVTQKPEKTPRVILIEGGHDPWEDDVIKAFADGGGQRVLFVSGQDINEKRSLEVASELGAAGIATKVVHAGDVGHIYVGPVREQIAGAFEWVVEGDDRWKK